MSLRAVPMLCTKYIQPNGHCLFEASLEVSLLRWSNILLFAYRQHIFVVSIADVRDKHSFIISGSQLGKQKIYCENQ